MTKHSIGLCWKKIYIKWKKICKKHKKIVVSFTKKMYYKYIFLCGGEL